MYDVAEKQTYNGWCNRETWLANLWLTNDQQSYNILMDAISVPAPAYEKAEWLKGQLEIQLDDELGVACMWQDLLRHAFNQIDWVELVRTNLE